jgi:hypothetical protein
MKTCNETYTTYTETFLKWKPFLQGNYYKIGTNAIKDHKTWKLFLHVRQLQYYNYRLPKMGNYHHLVLLLLKVDNCSVEFVVNYVRKTSAVGQIFHTENIQ